jgi:hypothetical protein
VINRLPQSKLGFKSPHEMLWKVKPTVSHLKVFGCVCYVFVPDHLRSKFEKKAIRCIFVGYDDARKGWRCCDPTTGKCHFSRNVVFDEASAWWSPEKVALPESHDLVEVPEEIQEESHDGIEKVLEEVQREEQIPTPDHSPSKGKSQWKMGVHWQLKRRFKSLSKNYGGQQGKQGHLQGMGLLLSLMNYLLSHLHMKKQKKVKSGKML